MISRTNDFLNLKTLASDSEVAGRFVLLIYVEISAAAIYVFPCFYSSQSVLALDRLLKQRQINIAIIGNLVHPGAMPMVVAGIGEVMHFARSPHA